MELRVLKYFLAVAREGSVTRAAETLYVTQPTLSRQLKELEDELGQKLFIRRYHHMTLTEEGKLLKQRAQEIIEMVSRTEADFHFMGKAIGGDIHIGGGETEAMKLIAHIMCKVQAGHPDVRFHLHSGTADDIAERIDKGTLDFGLLIQPAPTAKYDSIDLPAKNTWGIVMRKDCPLAANKTVTAEDLCDVPLILPARMITRNLSETADYRGWFGANFDRLKVVATYNLIYNAALMVEEGMGCAVTLAHLVRETESGPLCFRPLKPERESGMSLVWKKSRLFSTAAAIFLNQIREHFTGETPLPGNGRLPR